MKHFIVIGIVAGIIFLMVQFPHTMLSPGELIQGHQDLKNDCFSCHVPFGGIANDKCIACHQLSEIGKDTVGFTGPTKILFHQSLSNQSCIACHTDHKGTAPDIQMGGFQHSLLTENVVNNCVGCHQKPTDNLHRQLSSTCKSCHNTEGWKSSVEFNHDMLLVSDKNNCISCHQKPTDSFHKSLPDNCNLCHSTSKWAPATFEHSSYFVLDRDHNVSCTTCHKSSSYETYTCYGCHEHTVSNILAEHNEEGIYKINNCVSCHKSADEDGMESNEEGRGRNGDKDDDD